MFACVGDCSRCPFFSEETISVKTQKNQMVEQSVEEPTTHYEVKRTIFGKEKVVMIEEK